MDRDPAHWNVLTQVFAAFGQGNVERAGRADCIIEKKLVEIAHPVEQERVLIALLDLQKLGHHGSYIGVVAVGQSRFSHPRAIHSAEYTTVARDKRRTRMNDARGR